MVQAGLSAGVHLNILPTVGLRLFGSGGYSYNLVQPRVSDDQFYNLFHLNNSTAGGGTPFVGAGAELFWTFIPSFSLTAGARYLRYVDLYDGLALTLGVSYDLPVGPKPAKPSTQRAVPLKKAPNPGPSPGPKGEPSGSCRNSSRPAKKESSRFQPRSFPVSSRTGTTPSTKTSSQPSAFTKRSGCLASRMSHPLRKARPPWIP